MLPCAHVAHSLLHCTVVTGGRQPWDFGRFVKTVLFFNPPPQPGQLLQGLLSGLLGNGKQVSRLQEQWHQQQQQQVEEEEACAPAASSSIHRLHACSCCCAQAAARVAYGQPAAPR